LAVAFFLRPNLQSLEMFPQRIAHQGGAVLSRPLCSLIGGLQKLLVEDDLNYLHMWIILHTLLHMQETF
jgi:hypothetical protein